MSKPKHEKLLISLNKTSKILVRNVMQFFMGYVNKILNILIIYQIEALNRLYIHRKRQRFLEIFILFIAFREWSFVTLDENSKSRNWKWIVLFMAYLKSTILKFLSSKLIFKVTVSFDISLMKVVVVYLVICVQWNIFDIGYCINNKPRMHKM